MTAQPNILPATTEACFTAMVGGHLERHSPVPLYLQLQRLLRNAITNGVLHEDDVIPSERELAVELDVSRITIRKALEELVSEGLLLRRRGSGTFVACRVEKVFSRLSSFSEDMIARGRRPHAQWLLRFQGCATPEESLVLGLSPGASVYHFHRIRFADDQPLLLEYATIPAQYLRSVDAVDQSLYQALDATGHRPVRALQRLRAVNLSTEQAAKLGTKSGAAGLLIERRGFLSNGQTCEFTQSYFRGDTYDVVAELNDIS